MKCRRKCYLTIFFINECIWPKQCIFFSFLFVFYHNTGFFCSSWKFDPLDFLFLAVSSPYLALMCTVKDYLSVPSSLLIHG